MCYYTAEEYSSYKKWFSCCSDEVREDLVGLSGGKAPGIGNISVGLLKGRDKAMTRGLHAVLPA